MMQTLSEFSPQQVGQQICQTLGQQLSERELSSCLQQVRILEPSVGKPFWQATEAIAGIYIILTGKARLLDRKDNLIASLEAGKSFGELTLFPEKQFQPYTVRASANLQLCYLPSKLLQSLIDKYSTLGEHLYHQAVIQDLLFFCRQVAPLQSASLNSLMQVLSLLEPHTLQVEKLPNSLLKAQQLWLVRRGELVHPSGRRLTDGSIYDPSEFAQECYWQVTQLTELYALSKANWQTAKLHLPQLSELISADVLSEEEELDSRRVAVQGRMKNSSPRYSPLYRRLAGLPLRHSLLAPLRARHVPYTPQDSPHPTSVQQKHQRQNSRAYFPSPTVKVGHWWQRVTRRYPVFEQQSPSDCGAACLVMVGRYWGKRFSVNRLRDVSNVDLSGASLRGMAAAAESIGFTTRPVKASLDKLAEQTLPAIVHWQGEHYIVVYEVRRNHVIVADPAIGQRTLSPAEFKASWTGYALLLQPTALFKETKEDSQSFWQFFELVKPHWLIMLEVLVASILLQIFGLVTPLFTQLLLDRVLVQRSTMTLTAVGLGLLIFGLFRVAINGLRQYFLDHTANRLNLALLVGFISHTFQLPLSFFESRYVGDIVSRVQENYKIQRFLTGEALSIFLDLLTLFVYLGLMFWYSWKMALLALAIVPPFFLLALIATPFLRRISNEIFNARAAENSYLIEGLTGIRTVRAMAVEQTVRWHWEELLNKSIKAVFSGQVISNILRIISSSIDTVATTVLLWFGAWQVIQNELTIGQLVAFNMLLGSVIRPFQRLTVLWNQLQEVIISVERINDVIEAEPEEDLQHQPRQYLPQLRGHIRFEQVTFRYHPESDVNTLENVSFEVQPGQTVALVGRSGSGKTTISKLILGLYPPTEGKILIDGYDVTTLALRSLRQHIGVVDQDTFLFGGTIRANISIGRPEATLEDIRSAARQAGADQFIEELPMGYETQIGEGGGMLSGGQRQRLAIARALLGSPRLLILDEATSHLDAESERLIQINLNTIRKDRTMLVIAHRLSTVRKADLILVLDRGVLVESGIHEKLMAKRGHYFYLNQQQLAGIG